MRTTPDTEESIRCTVSGCTCVCFKPGSVQLRSCDRCGHGWVPHAMEKLHLQAQQPSSCGPVEVALPGPVFDLSSLVLYGAQAVPVRLKILLDRLYSILTPEQVGHILHTLGWSLGDYVRGYMLQFPNGKVLDHWLMVTPDEELLILKQFLRFGETRPIVELMALQCMAAVSHLPNPELNSAPKSCQSNINTFIKQNGGTPGVLRKTRGVAGVCCFKKSGLSLNDNTVHHFENLPGGQSLLPSFHFPSSAFHCLAPSTKELVPPSKLPQFLRKPSGTELAERHVHEGGRRAQENEVILEQAKGELPIKIKADPENPTGSIWHQNPRTNEDWERDLHKTKQENTSTLIHTSSSFPSSISSFSSSPISQRLQDSSSYSRNPLPSFSSSFLCPPPTSSFSSSLHPLPYSSSSLRPLPSSLCSLPSLSTAGGRKGRVCCGVCGKSFYDKGTLKIHYNAVHLKIKHRCTVAGCTMVFSSLRSRNRHSANPNPRLHTGASRDAHPHRNAHTSMHPETQTHKDKSAHKSIHNTHTHVGGEEEISSTLWQQEDDAHTLRHLHTLKNGHTLSQDGHQDNTPPQADSPPSSPLQTWSKDTIQGVTLSDSTYRSHLHTQAPPPPPLPSACGASSLGSPPSLVPLEKTERCQILLSLHTKHTAHDPPSGSTYSTTASRRSRPASRDDEITEGQWREACTSPPTNQQRLWESSDPVPKKKSRKSSMPVKIEREKVALRRTEEEEG